jgi:hypothetical protein
VTMRPVLTCGAGGALSGRRSGLAGDDGPTASDPSESSESEDDGDEQLVVRGESCSG